MLTYDKPPYLLQNIGLKKQKPAAWSCQDNRYLQYRAHNIGTALPEKLIMNLYSSL